jgi:hypothetical protein
MCGLIGGSPLEVEYVGNSHVLFDYFFPGVIPGTLFHTFLLPFPTVTLHTTCDPLVPYWHEQVYHLLAARKHRDRLLVQQSVNRFGHCEFQASEVLHAFSGLVGWVDFGIKPSGGDVTAR